MTSVLTSPAAARATTPSASASDRVALARRVLRLAEERTGAARWAGAVPGPDGGPDDDVPEVPLLEADARLLPVPAHLSGLLPRTALERGSTVVVTGSTSLVLGLLAEASRGGGWVAVVGLPDAGVLAAHQMGLELDRVVLVPAPGADAPQVVAALLDGVDAVVVGPAAVLTDADRRRLASRARERSAVLLPTTPWPGAHVVLAAGPSRWEGLGRGDGRLRSRRLVVQRSGRGAAARGARQDVLLPTAPPLWREVLDGSGSDGCAAPAPEVASLGRPELLRETPALPGDGTLGITSAGALTDDWHAHRRAG